MGAGTTSFHFKGLYLLRSSTGRSRQEPKGTDREAVTQKGTFRFESRKDSGETILNPKLLFR
jgi:hypothetical protein